MRERHYSRAWTSGKQAGTTGNARHAPSHLHDRIYGKNGAHNPSPLLKAYLP